jgi:hypothetical protein
MSVRIEHPAASPRSQVALCSVAVFSRLHDIAQAKIECLTNPCMFVLSQSEKARRILRIHR